MLDEDIEAQEDELTALTTIYDSDILQIDANEGDISSSGLITIHLDLPQPFTVQFDKKLIDVVHLPPIIFNFQLVSNYPSVNPPSYTITCKWLTLEQLTKLCNTLDNIWIENRNEVILFHWISFLKDDAYDFLGIQSPLNLSSVVVNKCSQYSVLYSDVDKRVIQDISSQDKLMPCILDYNTQRTAYVYAITLYNCQVCFAEKLGKQCMQFATCNHVFCNDCMKGYFNVLIDEGDVRGLKCPENKCESIALPLQIQSLVTEAQYNRYDRLLLQSTLDTMTDVIYCPRQNCGCAVVVDKEHNSGSCPKCIYVFCIYCKQTYHGLSACKISSENCKKLREEYLNADNETKKLLEKRYGRRSIQKLIEETFTHDWLNNNSKMCPRCHSHIEKMDGCNKMTCTHCHAYFCWICSELLNRANPYSHFNTAGTGCFNKLFQGVDLDDNDFEDEDDEWMEEVLWL